MECPKDGDRQTGSADNVVAAQSPGDIYDEVTGTALIQAGWEEGPAIGAALRYAKKWGRKKGWKAVWQEIEEVRDDPDSYKDDDDFNTRQIARQLIAARPPVYEDVFDKPRPHEIYGKVYEEGDDVTWSERRMGIDKGAVRQLRRALRLPVAVKGALMPDGHVGYSLPIGGVAVLNNAVWPMGVGVDIGCRMKLTFFPLDAFNFGDEGMRGHIRYALAKLFRFGLGAHYADPLDHPVLDDEAWNETRLLQRLQDKARSQVGSSGGGNHFADVGFVEVQEAVGGLGVAPGRYVALMTHSGSRGIGSDIARAYHDIAKRKRNLPPKFKDYAYLDMDSEEGQEYWRAMQLAGAYAEANHNLMHGRFADYFGVPGIQSVSNHHNFAWRDEANPELIIHRKGATPAGEGDIAIIPGSMGAASFIVVGQCPNNVMVSPSCISASHGAGRAASRTATRNRWTSRDTLRMLNEKGTEFVGGKADGSDLPPADEGPEGYKDIHKVMELQRDLVRPVAQFSPLFVRMASKSDPH